MDRQVAEALAIKEAYGDGGRRVLNAKTEYSRCVLPGVTPEASEEDKEQDEVVHRMIKELRKRKGMPEKEEETEVPNLPEVPEDSQPAADPVPVADPEPEHQGPA